MTNNNPEKPCVIIAGDDNGASVSLQREHPEYVIVKLDDVEFGSPLRADFISYCAPKDADIPALERIFWQCLQHLKPEGIFHMFCDIGFAFDHWSETDCFAIHPPIGSAVRFEGEPAFMYEYTFEPGPGGTK